MIQSEIGELAKRVPRIKSASGKTAMDHRSPEWREYQAALAANGREIRTRKAVAKACSAAIHDCEHYLSRVVR